MVLMNTQTYVKTDGFKNIYNFTLKSFVYLNLWYLERQSWLQ